MTSAVIYNSDTQSYQYTSNYVDHPTFHKNNEKIFSEVENSTCVQKVFLASMVILSFSTAGLLLCGINECFDGNQDKTCNCNGAVQGIAIAGEVIGFIGTCFSGILWGCCGESKKESGWVRM